MQIFLHVQIGELSAAVVSVVIHLSLQEVNFFFVKFIIEQETFHKLPEVSLCDNVMIWQKMKALFDQSLFYAT